MPNFYISYKIGVKLREISVDLNLNLTDLEKVVVNITKLSNYLRKCVEDLKF